MVFLFLEKWKLFKGKLVEKQGRKARRVAPADFGRCPFCMPKWVKKLAGTGSLYTDKSRMKKA